MTKIQIKNEEIAASAFGLLAMTFYWGSLDEGIRAHEEGLEDRSIRHKNIEIPVFSIELYTERSEGVD